MEEQVEIICSSLHLKECLYLFGKLFKKDKVNSVEDIYSPLSGELVSIENVPDPVFAQRMMGDGIAIIPNEGILVSPVEGKVIQVFHTKHAIGIQSNNGIEILLHIGLETVELNGEGFEVLVSEGQKVNVGDILVKFDIAFLQSQNKEIITSLVITNSTDKVTELIQIESKVISRSEKITTCTLK